MFTNLLAKSMNIDYKANVHPSFVELIKQLSPLDAINLKYINDETILPIANIRAQISEHKTDGQDVFTNLFLNTDVDTDAQSNSISITNLYRLGLVDLTYTSHLTEESAYKSLYAHDMFLSAKQYFTSSNPNNKTKLTYTTLQQGMVSITPLGKTFVSVCCN